MIIDPMKIYHWNEIKDKIKKEKYIVYVEVIRDVVNRHGEIIKAYIFGSFARELLAEAINPEYRNPKYGRPFRDREGLFGIPFKSDIDVFVLCREEFIEELKEEGWCKEDLMIKLEKELPEIDGHEVSWDTAEEWMVMQTPFKIQIKP